MSLVSLIACAQQSSELKQASRNLSQAIRQGDQEALAQQISPVLKGSIDYRQILAAQNRVKLANELANPAYLQSQALIFVSHDDPLQAQLTSEGWAFSEDPTNFYDQSTPRAALRSFVRASIHERWDILIQLAPQRYRMGLSENDLRRAWTEGEYAKALAAARDRLKDHLSNAIQSDHDNAVLEIEKGKFARLEREGSSWVVVDF